MDRNILHFYRQNRAHQLTTYGNSGLHINGIDQRQFTAGSAAYGEHAIAAYWAARRNVHFRETFTEDMKANKRRSKAAKRGWKTRRTL